MMAYDQGYADALREISDLKAALETEKAKVATLRMAILKHQRREFHSDHPALRKALADTDKKEM